jgi:hypothetical protein
MIQLFLIIVILVILITIINKTETFYVNTCNKTNLYAMNSYYTDTDDTDDTDNTHPCINLILENDTNLNPDSMSGSIIIKNKHKDVPLILDIKDINVEEGVPTQNTLAGTTTAVNTQNNKIILRLTEATTTYLELGNTYQITLNIKNEDDDKYTIYDTIEITFKEVNLSNDDLNLNQPNTNLLTILKNKKINLII